MPPIQFDRLSEHEDRLRRSGYQQLEPFFVLREGFIKDNRTNGVLHLNKARLEKVAAIQNQRIADTGDFTPIIIGHTKRGKAEVEQPPLTGWASRFNVVPFLDGKTWGLQAIPWSKPANLENFEKYPRRSAEMWTDPDLIDPISILGANTPRLDLGIHRLQRNTLDDEIYVPRHNRTGEPIYLENAMADENDTSADKPASGKGEGDGGGGGGGSSGVLQQVFNSPEWKELSNAVQQMAAVVMPLVEEMKGAGGPAGGMPPGGAAPPPGGPPGAPPAQMSGHPMHYGGHPMNNPMSAGPHVPVQNAGHPGMVGHPGNTGVHPGHEPQPHLGDAPMQYAGHPGHVQHIVTHQPPAAHIPLPGGHPGMHPHHQMNMGGGGIPGGTNVQMPHMLSRDGGYDPRDQQIAALQQQLAAMQLSMIENTVNGVLDELQTRVTVDRPRDFARLVRMSKAEMDAEVQFMVSTRKPIEQPTPPIGVPLHMQAGGNQPGAARQPMGPIQLTLGQAHDMLDTPPDPAMAAAPDAAKSEYDQLMSIVRNRGKLGNLEAYEQMKSKMFQSNNGVTSVRG